MNRQIKVLVGVSGSGKTTWATKFINENPKWVRVSRDDIRRQLVGTLDQIYYKRKDLNSLEKQVTALLFSNIRHLLQQEFNIIVDNTHLKESYINELVVEFNHLTDIEIEFIGVEESLATLKRRIEEREDKRVWWKKLFSSEVNTSYLNKQFKEFNTLHKKGIQTKFPILVRKVNQNYKLPNTIICDLDGTLALFGDRNPYDRDFENDMFSPPVLFVLKSWIHDNPDCKIHFFSGRAEKERGETTRFLLREFTEDQFILEMRKNKDVRNDSLVKEDMFNTYIKDKLFVHFVIDDRLRVCRLWNKLGLFLFNVNQDLSEF